MNEFKWYLYWTCLCDNKETPESNGSDPKNHPISPDAVLGMVYPGCQKHQNIPDLVVSRKKPKHFMISPIFSCLDMLRLPWYRHDLPICPMSPTQQKSQSDSPPSNLAWAEKDGKGMMAATDATLCLRKTCWFQVASGDECLWHLWISENI